MLRGLALTLLVGCGFRPTPATSNQPDGPITMLDGSIDAPPDGTMTTSSGRRKAITIAKANLPNTVTSFPVWFDITDADVRAGARADGSDIYFTDSNGVAVPYEIRGWDHTTGHLSAWFRAPQLMKNTDMVFYLYYAGTAAAPAPDPATTFSAYAAVWHLDDSLATPTIAEARGTAPGTATNLNPTRQVPAKLGGGVDFDGTTMLVTFDNMVTGNTSSTISAWVQERSANGMDSIVTLGTASDSNSRFLYSVYQNNHVGAGLWNNDWTDAGTNVQNAGWTLLHWTFDGGNNKSALYRDGASSATHTFNSGVDTQGTTAAGWIGYSPSGWGTNHLNGILDEVRISKSVLTPDWIKIEYLNQNAPASFYTVGAEQILP